jgi:hypothetical protein
MRAKVFADRLDPLADGSVRERVVGLGRGLPLVWGARRPMVPIDVADLGADRVERAVAGALAVGGRVGARRRNAVVIAVVEGLGVLGVKSIVGLSIGAIEGARRGAAGPAGAQGGEIIVRPGLKGHGEADGAG